MPPNGVSGFVSQRNVDASDAWARPSTVTPLDLDDLRYEPVGNGKARKARDKASSPRPGHSETLLARRPDSDYGDFVWTPGSPEQSHTKRNGIESRLGGGHPTHTELADSGHMSNRVDDYPRSWTPSPQGFEGERLLVDGFGLDDRLKRMMLETDRLIISRYGQGLQRYIEGDSYPATTSGGPSAGDEQELSERLPDCQADNHVPRDDHQAWPQTQQVDWRLLPAAAPYTTAATRAEQQQPTNYVDRPACPPATGMPEVFGKRASSAALPCREPASSDARVPQPGSHVVVPRMTKDAPGGAQAAQHEVVKDIITAPQRRADLTPTPRQGLAHDIQQDQSPAEPTNGLKLDIEPPRLYETDYSTLKRASFTPDPHAAPLALKGVQADDSLETRLHAVSRLGQQDQARFFASLSLDEWEDSGEWFVQRFGQLFERLKAARRDRRSAAHAFEREIEARHEAIAIKREQTDNAMGEMRESGYKVLQGTPKRTRAMQ